MRVHHSLQQVQRLYHKALIQHRIEHAHTISLLKHIFSTSIGPCPLASSQALAATINRNTVSSDERCAIAHKEGNQIPNLFRPTHTPMGRSKRVCDLHMRKSTSKNREYEYMCVAKVRWGEIKISYCHLSSRKAQHQSNGYRIPSLIAESTRQ